MNAPWVRSTTFAGGIVGVEVIVDNGGKAGTGEASVYVSSSHSQTLLSMPAMIIRGDECYTKCIIEWN